MLEFIKDTLSQVILKTIPAPIFIVNGEGQVYAINDATQEFFHVAPQAFFHLQRGGELVNCVNAHKDQRGCGYSLYCPECVLRQTALATIAGNSVKRAKGKITVEQDNQIKQFTFLVSSAPLQYENQQLAILIAEDISQIVELQGLIPICSHCKKICNDHGKWERMEQYIQAHSECEFSHDICPTCAAKLYY